VRAGLFFLKTGSRLKAQRPGWRTERWRRAKGVAHDRRWRWYSENRCPIWTYTIPNIQQWAQYDIFSV